MKICEIEQCEGKHKAKGLCRVHYNRLRYTGKPTKYRHGLATPGSEHPLYSAWESMRQRCNNPKSRSYKNYGGRGIAVCARWDNFANFVADMGEKPFGRSLDRKDNDGDYTPENCRWATIFEQNRNQRPRRVFA